MITPRQQGTLFLVSAFLAVLILQHGIEVFINGQAENRTADPFKVVGKVGPAAPQTDPYRSF